VTETLLALKEGGLKLGLLSDFPPETKLKYLNIPDLWDTVLCSETIGALKPDPLPFAELARSMGLPPEKILYVGNSFPYDVAGAKKAGMKAAWVSRGFAARGLGARRKSPGAFSGVKADFVFSGYRQLRDYVLT
jgi:putative hydrolase of the HAD superfamily